MKRIGLYVKQDEEALNKADAFEKWLRSENIEVVREQTHIPENLEERKNLGKTAAPDDLFCVFVLGGDGTFLSASRLAPTSLCTSSASSGVSAWKEPTCRQGVTIKCPLLYGKRFMMTNATSF